MQKNILEDERFVTGKGYLAFVKTNKIKGKPNGNQYHKINELTTKMPVEDYFRGMAGFGSQNFTSKLFRFEKLTVFKLNKGKNLPEYAFTKLASSDLGAVISMSALNSILELSGLNMGQIYLLANVSSQPFIVTDKSHDPIGLIFPHSNQWIDSESFYNNEVINIVRDHDIFIKPNIKAKKSIINYSPVNSSFSEHTLNK